MDGATVTRSPKDRSVVARRPRRERDDRGVVWDVVRVVLAIIVAVLVYVIGAGMISKFKAAPPEEPDPEDIKPVHLRFRCQVCGAEETMTAAHADDPEPPRHCREDMVLV
jgi:hypothetical protein